MSPPTKKPSANPFQDPEIRSKAFNISNRYFASYPKRETEDSDGEEVGEEEYKCFE